MSEGLFDRLDQLAAIRETELIRCAERVNAGWQERYEAEWKPLIEENRRLREALDWIEAEPEDALKVQTRARTALEGR